MNKGRLIKYSLFGFGAQVVAGVVYRFAGEGFRGALGFLYWPWFVAGETVLPSGAGGHAFPAGGMVGSIVGIGFYSLLIGAGFYFASTLNRKPSTLT